MVVVLAISALLFLGTVGYLIKNAAAVAELFAKRPVDADPGDLIDGPARASRGTVVAVLTLHLLGIIGLIASAAVMTSQMASDHPDGLPADMNPVGQEGNG